MPLLGDRGHEHLVEFLKRVAPSLGQPEAILIISAHWEAPVPTITGGDAPHLIYDYFGFPDEAYTIEYPTPGQPALAEKIYHLLYGHGIEANLDNRRGFDHGVFVPLKIMYPDAGIPCVQLSLVNSLDPATHINLGKALAGLRWENILVIGSGFSFHNLPAFFARSETSPDAGNDAFQQWLIDTCTRADFSSKEREKRLIEWEKAPSARYCHPREEHLLPLQVCFGIAAGQTPTARVVFFEDVLGKRVIALQW